MTEKWVVAENFHRILDESFDEVHAGFMRKFLGYVKDDEHVVDDLKREPEWFGTHDLTKATIDLIDVMNDSDGMPQEYIEQRLKSIAFDINDNDYPLI